MRHMDLGRLSLALRQEEALPSSCVEAMAGLLLLCLLLRILLLIHLRMPDALPSFGFG
jgi:hypothetical protein